MNTHLERFFGSLKNECLDQLILFGETALCNAVRQYLERDHTQRCHQGLGNQLILPMEHLPITAAEMESKQRLGGLLRSYRRAA